jgi:hypothetical protein
MSLRKTFPREDMPFLIGMFAMIGGPVAAALYWKSAWWLLLYIPVLLIIGL